ncbi:outer membrane protein assembly factor BamB family protein [Haladaptatus sp. NG-WS-4]
MNSRSRRDFLRTAGVGLMVAGSGCSIIQGSSRWTVELDGMLSPVSAPYDGGFVVGNTRSTDTELGTVSFDGTYERVTNLPRTTTSPVVYENTAYIEANGVVCEASMDANDFERLDTEHLSFSWFPPVVADSRMFIAGYSGRVQQFGLFALDLTDRRVAWRRPFGETPTTVATDGENVFVSTEKGTVRAYSADGDLRWTHSTSKNAYLTCDDGVVFVTSNDGVSALSPDGRTRWHANVDGTATSMPVVTKSSAYAVLSLYGDGEHSSMATDPRLVAYGRKNGNERWREQLPGSVSVSPSAIDGAVAVGTIGTEGDSDADYLSVYDESGERRHRYAIDGGIRMRPILRNGMVVVGSFDGVIEAYER